MIRNRAGHPQTIRATRSRFSGFRHRMRRRVRELLPTPESHRFKNN